MTTKAKPVMTPAEIEAATDNPDVDWGFIYCGTRSIGQTLWRRIVLWFGIVGRVNQADYRTGPILAWQICGCIYPWREPVKAWGIVEDRRVVRQLPRSAA